jgi:hypothetical protein
MNDYAVNDFGEARFPVSRKGCKRYITASGIIKAIEKKVLMFVDNDGFTYLIDKKDFQFTKSEFKIQFMTKVIN